ncbi:hypothetical protein [Nocardioides alpinus]|uniref:hypothetical protein n=1 Tax=Nocardioides alpinus TaxID=748909 RepID=UPI0012FF0DDC|nr:hypothetical protein [Nocardioides alpinus]
MRVQRRLPVQRSRRAGEHRSPLALRAGGAAGVVDVDPGVDRDELAAAEQASYVCG